MKALIDGDILVYRVGFASQDVDEGIAKWRLNDMISRMLGTLETEDYTVYLTSTNKSNFRFDLFKEYKANRVQPKPIHYLMLRETLETDYAATVVEGQEADDALGIVQTHHRQVRGDDRPGTNDAGGTANLAYHETCICTIDKDLDQIPGWHYNFVKQRKYNISPIEGYRSFYWQCLVGDVGDNIEGCRGIGKVRATRILEGCETEEEMYQATLSRYDNAFGDEALDRLLLAGNLLWIRRKPDEGWTRPNLEVVSKEHLANSLKTLV